jgi:hypothetical protein
MILQLDSWDIQVDYWFDVVFFPIWVLFNMRVSDDAASIEAFKMQLMGGEPYYFNRGDYE